MTAMLLMTRPFQFADAAQPCQVLLDGDEIGVVCNSSSAEVPIAPGQHTLQMYGGARRAAWQLNASR